MMKDPFSREGSFMIVGGHCSLCHSEVCCNQVWYTEIPVARLLHLVAKTF